MTILITTGVLVNDFDGAASVMPTTAPTSGLAGTEHTFRPGAGSAPCKGVHRALQG